MANSYIPNYLLGSSVQTPQGSLNATPSSLFGSPGSNVSFGDKGSASSLAGFNTMMSLGYVPQYTAAQQSQLNSPLTVIGQGEAWLTPDELRAKNDALQTNLNWGGSGSGGGIPAAENAGSESTGAGQVGGLGGGGLLSGGNNIPNTANPTGFTGFPNIPGGNLNSGGTINPGSNPGQVTGQGSIPGNPAQAGQPLSMTQMGAGSALQNYYNTPGYQLTNGQGAVNNFQTGPGYQFAVNDALNQVARQGASRGLLDSGAGLRAMTDRAQGMANQEFNNWQQNQQNQYNQYQNRLQGLASGPTGSEMAYNLGQSVGNNNMQTGGNIGSILANQGNSLFGGIVGAGGAQAQNVTQAGNMQAQILGNNLQTQMMLAALAAGQGAK